MDLQKYAGERITVNEIDFNSFTYKNSYAFAEREKKVVVTETFVDKQTQFVRKNEQTLFMPSVDDLVGEIRACGFEFKEKIATMENGSDIYVFRKV